MFVPRLTSTPRVERIRHTSYNHAETPVLFHITQVHTPETCPRDEGGSNSLFNPGVEGVKLIGRYGANAQHTLFLIVEADDVNDIHKFLWPGFTRCTSTITPSVKSQYRRIDQVSHRSIYLLDALSGS